MRISNPCLRPLLALTLLLGLVSGTAAAHAGVGAFAAPLQVAQVDAHGIVVEARDVNAWRELQSGPGTIVIERFPLSARQTVDLELTRFSVTGPETRFVVGSAMRPLDFDPSSVTLLRGSVPGLPGSKAFLALSEHGSLGYVDLGEADTRFEISSAASTSPGAPAGLRISPTAPAGGWSLPVPLCGLDAPDVPDPGPQRAVVTASGTQRLELAVETDHELFQLFGDLSATSAYIVSLYAAVSDIYARDVNAWIELSFVRLWDTPADLFNDQDPLVPFRLYWDANMGAVQRDLAQFFSGRRDLAYGGIAYLSTVCNSSFGYSVCGYALGFFTDPTGPAIGNRDITVAAHELGHSCSASHTHNYGLDTCDDENSDPRRGTIMSYCGQTFTGGEANMDPRFHTTVQDVIQSFLESRSCVDDDCNQNGVDDATDIAMSTSLDVNTNGVPDECEDCNGNGTLDPDDISMGTSTDLDGNGVPDDCEADCNSNSTPDALDISLATSADLNSNRIPDECEPDCDTDGTLDYVQIIADMSLDLNRNAVLDSCEDWNSDGTTDLVDLDHANNVWITSLDHTTLREYLAHVGPLTDVSDDAGIGAGQDLIITPNRRMLVSDALGHRVVEFEVDGTLVGDLVAAGAGGLSSPAGLVIGPRGTLLVASRGTDEVLEYNAHTGAPLGPLVTAGSGGLVEPFGLALGSRRDLYVTSNDGRVLRYGARSGRFIDEFVRLGGPLGPKGNGGLTDPHGLLFLPNGNLLVASYDTDQILEYEALTGDFLRQFNQGGTVDRLTLDQPWSLRLGPNGNVFVSRAHDHDGKEEAAGGAPDQLHLTNARIYEFDVELGFFIRAYILGVNTGIEHPTGFDFVPATGGDCNRNLLPDDFDIASGFSLDLNLDGIPDECNADCNLNGQADFMDISLGASSDCDGDGIPDECGGFADCNQNGIPDACELPGNDANGNGILDACESGRPRAGQVDR